MQIEKLFETLGHSFDEMEIDVPIDVSSKRFQIRSFDNETQVSVWANILKIVRKEPSDAYVLLCDGKKVEVTALHQFWVSDGKWMTANEASGYKDLCFLT